VITPRLLVVPPGSQPDTSFYLKAGSTRRNAPAEASARTQPNVDFTPPCYAASSKGDDSCTYVVDRPWSSRLRPSNVRPRQATSTGLSISCIVSLESQWWGRKRHGQNGRQSGMV